MTADARYLCCSWAYCTRGVQKVRRQTQLTRRYAHHILSLFNTVTLQLKCAWSSISPKLWNRCRRIVVLGLPASHMACRRQEILCLFMNSFSLGKNRSHLDNASNHRSAKLLAAIQKCRLWTTPSPTVFAIRVRIARQMARWKTKNNNSSTRVSDLWRNAGPSAFQL